MRTRRLRKEEDRFVSLRNDLAAVLARDSRYSIHAYSFVLDALEHAKSLKKRAQARSRGRDRASDRSKHVGGRELCEGARRLAVDHYGMMALTVLKLWGLRSTSDPNPLIPSPTLRCRRDAHPSR